MDLSIRHVNTEAFEYRHKKFDQVRTSPITVHSQHNISTPTEEARSMASTPNSFVSNSTHRSAIKRELEDNDTTWKPSTDEIEPPCTPTKRQRMQSRSSRNKRTAAYELCNAPKKRKSAQYDARAATPEKCATSIHATPNLMPQISKEALARICQYNKNMVRKFPKKERSLKDQERRDKNTIACRMSRRLKKLENLAVEEQYKIFSQEYFEQSKQAMHAAVYLNELLKFDVKISVNEANAVPMNSIAKKLELHFLEKITTKVNPSSCKHLFQEGTLKAEKLPKQEIEENLPTNEEKHPLAAQRKRSFSIAYLLGSE